MSSDLDVVNRSAWKSDKSLHKFATDQGWTNSGEQAAITLAARTARGLPILDVGIGGGRTTSLLLLVSDEYIGLDYTHEMVELARRAHPDIDIRDGDARDLAGLPDDHFALVVFSFNGIDAIEREGRRRALEEFRRVARRDGLVVVSTLNKNGPSFRLRPWQLLQLRGPIAHPVARFILSFPLRAASYWRGYRNWSRLRRQSEDHGDWAIAPLAAHEFGLLVHYTTLAQALEDVAAIGFNVVAVFDDDGARLAPTDDTSAVDCFQLVLQRRS